MYNYTLNVKEFFYPLFSVSLPFLSVTFKGKNKRNKIKNARHVYFLKGCVTRKSFEITDIDKT